MSFLRYRSSQKSFGGLSAVLMDGRTWTPAAARFLVLVVFCAGTVFAQSSQGRDDSATVVTGKEISQYLVARNARPIEPPAQSSLNLSVNAIVEKITKDNAQRWAELSGFQGKRWYHLQYHGFLGGRQASMEVLATYSAPNNRNFTVISESGSKLLLNGILMKLLQSEQRGYASKKSLQLNPENYNFELIGTDKTPDGTPCYVLAVKARQPDELLYNGKIWVNANDFAVVKMEGAPSKSPSFWIKDTEIQSQWEKIGNFWFIAHNQSVSHIRMGGVATLTIDYGDYQFTAADGRTAKTQAQGTDLPDPTSVTPQR
ncbi:MAG TPA: hypothetical protein VLW06_12870 [Terriglobales bacterium]|nr:hypothetical protein [Terriglobales bacterium]